MAVTGAAIATWAAANAGTIAAVSAAASVASTAYSIYSQNQAASAQAKSASEQNQQAALQAAASYDDLSPAEIDANRQANDLAMQQQAEAMQARGRVNLFAAASGTMGGSVDSMLFDVNSTKDRNINSILMQREAGLYSIRQQAEQIRQGGIGAQNRTAISTPSWIEGGLKVGSAVIQGFDQYGRMNKDTFSLQDKVTSKRIQGGV